MNITLGLALVLLCSIAWAQPNQSVTLTSAENDIEECERRPKYIMLPLDLLLPDVVEFIYRTGCSTTEFNPFSSNLQCVFDLLDDPFYLTKWTVDRNHFPRVVALKRSLCRYTEIADRCHNYTEAARRSFTCPPSFADELAQGFKSFFAAKAQILCNASGTPMQLFAAADGDVCIIKWRKSLVECMYQSLAPLRMAHLRNLNNTNMDQSLSTICRAFDLVRYCSFHKLSQCSTSIPFSTVDLLMRELSRRFTCPNGQRLYSDNLTDYPTITTRSP